jgi:hypothetical protein
MMKKLLFTLCLCGCVSAQTPTSSLVDSSQVVPPPPSIVVDSKDLRLGSVKYSKDRYLEREAIAWHFTPDGSFFRGVPREDRDSYDSIKAKIYEVGFVEEGKYRGFALERWDVIDEVVVEDKSPKVFRYHHYFLRKDGELVHLPAMTKGSSREFWQKGTKGAQVLSFLKDRWNVGISSDKKFAIQELNSLAKVQVPGQGSFQATSAGESAAEMEKKMGTMSVLTTVGKGREVFRVPGDWIVLLYPDGLAVYLKKE